MQERMTLIDNPSAVSDLAVFNSHGSNLIVQFVASVANGKLGICVSVVILGALISCTLLAYTAFASPASNHSGLQQVIILFRHGDRNPLMTYPKDPYKDYVWPGGLGSLTKKGMLQLYNVGQWIREEYGTLIGNKFENSATLVRSSSTDRCIMSALTLLAGLFPPSPEDMFVPNLAWTPVPVHAIPRNLDKLITVKAPCPRLDEALKQAYIEEDKKSGSKMANYYKELSEHTGSNISTITDVEFLYNTFELEEQHGLQLPEWTKKFYNDEMREISVRGLKIFTEGTVQKRLRGGPFLKEILLRMEETKNDSGWKRSYFYSAHDITIINVMRTMGLETEHLKPDYGASLIFELYRANGEVDQEVKVLYLNNSETRIASPLKIPNCGSACLLQNLKRIWHPLIPNNWDAECKL